MEKYCLGKFRTKKFFMSFISKPVIELWCCLHSYIDKFPQATHSPNNFKKIVQSKCKLLHWVYYGILGWCCFQIMEIPQNYLSFPKFTKSVQYILNFKFMKLLQGGSSNLSRSDILLPLNLSISVQSQWCVLTMT